MSGFNEQIAELAEAKAALSAANKEAKALKATHDELEGALIKSLKDAGLDRVSAGGFTASHNVEIVASVNDWESFYAYVKENDAFYLLQKRVASSAYRELLAIEGESPPGTEPHEKDKLSFTKA